MKSSDCHDNDALWVEWDLAYSGIGAGWDSLFKTSQAIEPYNGFEDWEKGNARRESLENLLDLWSGYDARLKVGLRIITGWILESWIKLSLDGSYHIGKSFGGGKKENLFVFILVTYHALFEMQQNWHFLSERKCFFSLQALQALWRGWISYGKNNWHGYCMIIICKRA